MTFKVLVVEDEAILAVELESILTDLGHEVVGIAATSADALRLAAEAEPDLALVDIHLGDGPTGVAVARRLSKKRDTCVLFTTCNPGRIPHDFANAFGALAKPFSDQEVRLVLEFVADSRAREMAALSKPRALTLSPEISSQLRLS